MKDATVQGMIKYKTRLKYIKNANKMLLKTTNHRELLKEIEKNGQLHISDDIQKARLNMPSD
jgi:hypothetical protein